MIERSGKVGLCLESELVALFIQTANKFSSKINIIKENKIANAKSIMGLISLDVVNGETIKLSALGEDAETAIAELAAFLKIT